jgi:hypothetical protein
MILSRKLYRKNTARKLKNARSHVNRVYVAGPSRQDNVISAQRVLGTEVIQRTLPLFPSSVQKRLRYSTNITLGSTAGAVASQVYAVNGLFDPDVTGTGHQPMGFDEMMIYFNHYIVVACHMTVVAKNASATKMTVSVRQDASSTPITVIDRLVEIGGGVIEYLEYSTTALATKKLQISFDIAKMQGVSRIALTADSALRGTSVANPSELSYAHLQIWDAAAASGTVANDVILEFDAIFKEPRDGTASITERLEELHHAFRCRKEEKKIENSNFGSTSVRGNTFRK